MPRLVLKSLSAGTAILLAGCQSTAVANDPPTYPLGVHAKLAGTPWTASSWSARYSNGYLTLSAATDTAGSLSVVVPAGNHPGEFSLIGVAPAVVGSYALGNAYWGGDYETGNGTITIATYDTTGVSGTFAFTLNAATGPASGLKVFTDGTFNVRF